jgi:hypothetical protein
MNGVTVSNVKHKIVEFQKQVEECLEYKQKEQKCKKRFVNEFKKFFLNRINLVKDENGNLCADSHIILSMWKMSLIRY